MFKHLKNNNKTSSKGAVQARMFLQQQRQQPLLHYPLLGPSRFRSRFLPSLKTLHIKCENHMRIQYSSDLSRKRTLYNINT